MSRKFNLYIYFSILYLFLNACAVNSLTGKSQLSLVSDNEIINSAKDQYGEFLKKSKVIDPISSKDAALVERVGDKLVNAINKYYTEKNMQIQLDGYTWEYHLIEENQVNAWCMPGGKIVVYTGILPLTNNEASLAIVLGHEVSHALLNHGKKRMSEQMMQQVGAHALSLLTQNKSKESQDLFLKSYGIGTEIGVMLPFSRQDELEADKYGLVFAAMAGYDPRQAIAFWERMSKQSAGQKPPEILSTHPSDEKRIEYIKAYLPEALKYFENK